MYHHSSCIAVFAKSEKSDKLNEAKDFLLKNGMNRNGMAVVSKRKQKYCPTLHHDVENLLQQSAVPEGSRYCYHCALEMGYTLLIIAGSKYVVEQVSSQLERLGEIDISVHFDLTL